MGSTPTGGINLKESKMRFFSKKKVIASTYVSETTKNDAVSWYNLFSQGHEKTKKDTTYIAILYSYRDSCTKAMLIDSTFNAHSITAGAPCAEVLQYMCNTKRLTDLIIPQKPNNMDNVEFAVQESLGVLPERTLCEKVITMLLKDFSSTISQEDIKGVYKVNKLAF